MHVFAQELVNSSVVEKENVFEWDWIFFDVSPKVLMLVSTIPFSPICVYYIEYILFSFYM